MTTLLYLLQAHRWVRRIAPLAGRLPALGGGQIDATAATPASPTTDARVPVRRRVAQAGVLQVHGGALWLTRDGDDADHLVEAGARLALPAGAVVTLGAWQRGEAVRWSWSAGAPCSSPATAPAGPALTRCS